MNITKLNLLPLSTHVSIPNLDHMTTDNNKGSIPIQAIPKINYPAPMTPQELEMACFANFDLPDNATQLNGKLLPQQAPVKYSSTNVLAKPTFNRKIKLFTRPFSTRWPWHLPFISGPESIPSTEPENLLPVLVEADRYDVHQTYEVFNYLKGTNKATLSSKVKPIQLKTKYVLDRYTNQKYPISLVKPSKLVGREREDRYLVKNSAQTLLQLRGNKSPLSLFVWGKHDGLLHVLRHELTPTMWNNEWYQRTYCMRAKSPLLSGNLEFALHHDTVKTSDMLDIIKNAKEGERFYLALPETADDLVVGGEDFKHLARVDELGIVVKAAEVYGEVLKLITIACAKDLRKPTPVKDSLMPWGHLQIYSDDRRPLGSVVISGDDKRIVCHNINKPIVAWQNKSLYNAALYGRNRPVVRSITQGLNSLLFNSYMKPRTHSIETFRLYSSNTEADVEEENAIKSANLLLSIPENSSTLLLKESTQIQSLILRLKALDSTQEDTATLNNVRKEFISYLNHIGFNEQDVEDLFKTSKRIEEYTYRDKDLNVWLEEYRVLLEVVDLEPGKLHYRQLKKTFRNLAQVEILTGNDKNWSVWKDLWEGVESRVKGGSRAGLRKDIGHHLLNYLVKSSDALNTVLTRWESTHVKDWDTGLAKVRKAVEDLSEKVRMLVLEMVSTTFVKYSELLDYRRPTMAKEGYKFLNDLPALEVEDSNATQLLQNRLYDVWEVYKLNGKDAYDKQFKGYNVLHDAGLLYESIETIINSNVTSESKQAAMERMMVKHAEETFKKAIESGDKSVAEKVLVKGYETVLKLIRNEIIDKLKISKYKKVITNLEKLSNEDVSLVDEKTAFGKMDKYMKCLLTITIGAEVVASDSMMIAVETLSRFMKTGPVNQQQLASKLASRLRTRLANVKTNKKPEDWPDITLHNNFTVEKAVNILRSNPDHFFMSFAVELVNILCFTKAVTKDTRYLSKNKSVVEFYITPEGMHNLTLATSNPVDLPMLCPPRGMSYGKYYPYVTDEANQYHNAYHTTVRPKAQMLKSSSNTAALSNTVNTLNNQRFVINREVLDFLLDEFNDHESSPELNIFGCYNQPYPISEEPNSKERMKQRAHNSIYYQHKMTLSIASLFRDCVFYLPVTADFRGRIYVLCSSLSYQAGDLSRALIGFYNESERLTQNGISEIYHYAANVAGFDKRTRKEREEIGEEKLIEFGNMIATGDRNKVREMLNTCDEPMQFLSCAFSMAKAAADIRLKKGVHYSNQPILFDASCNGTQHIAAMLKDKELAKYVNLITDKSGARNDYYSHCLSLVKSEVENWVPTSEKDKKVRIDFLKNIKMTRSLIKKPVMTMNYNITLEGVKDQLATEMVKEWEDDVKEYFYHVPSTLSHSGEEFKLTGKEFHTFSRIVYETLRNQPSVKNITEYLNDLATVMLKAKESVTWIIPTGMVVHATYQKFVSKGTKANIFQSSKPVTLQIPTGKIDAVKSKRAFLANFIHSLDASNIHLLVDLMHNRKDIPLYTVHDCFATTPNNMKEMEAMVKEAFILIYFGTKGYLSKMHDHIVNDLRSKYEVKELVEDGVVVTRNGQVVLVVVIDEEELVIPSLPGTIGDEVNEDFINGIRSSEYFLS